MAAQNGPEVTAEPAAHADHQQRTLPPWPRRSSRGVWLVLCVAVVGLVWFATHLTSERPGGSERLLSAGAAALAAPETVERKPEVGRNRLLGPTEARYCVAEKIRLEGAKAVVRAHLDAEVDRFNALVGDYSRRCASFRYAADALAAARADAEASRAVLEEEGRRRFAQTAATATRPTRDKKPSGTVAAIQSLLDDLGYEVGEPDGLTGPKTSAAIKSFQSDQNLRVDGVPGLPVLQRLMAVSPDGLSTVEMQHTGLYVEPLQYEPIRISAGADGAGSTEPR
jgi:hypothetical protein